MRKGEIQMKKASFVILILLVVLTSGIAILLANSYMEDSVSQSVGGIMCTATSRCYAPVQLKPGLWYMSGEGWSESANPIYKIGLESKLYVDEVQKGSDSDSHSAASSAHTSISTNYVAVSWNSVCYESDHEFEVHCERIVYTWEPHTEAGYATE